MVNGCSTRRKIMPMRSSHPPARAANAVAFAFVLLAFGASAGQAQTSPDLPAMLSLSPSAATAQFGQDVTFTVLLNGGNNIAAYDFNVSLDPSCLAFVDPASPFTPDAGSGFAIKVSDGSSGGTMETSSFDLSDLGTQSNTPLGVFTVVVTDVPTNGATTWIAFGPTSGFGSSGTALTGGSEVDDDGDVNMLSGVAGANLTLLPAPEPSGLCILMIGAVTVCLAMLRRRRCRS
jgi:hypothetical protein